MSKDFIKKATGVYNAAELGYLEGQVIGTVCLGLMGFSFLSALILGTPWAFFGYSILLTVCILDFLFFRALAYWILVGIDFFKGK